MKLGNNLEAEYNQLVNPLLHNLGADPTPGASTKYGLVWFDTGAAKEAKVWDGTAVQVLSNRLQSVTGTGAISVGAISAKNQAISIAAASGAALGTMSIADFNKLAGISASATANSSDATLLARANHTGTQLAATISDLTKTSVGLGSVDNTTDAGKPVSTAQATAIGLKANLASPAFTGTPTGITATHVGLGSVNNTTDAAKPLSTAAVTESAVAKARANHTGTQLRSTISDFDAGVQAQPLNALAVPITSVAMNNQKITGLAEPVSPGDATTKNYVDGVASGLDVKASCRASSIANVVVTYSSAGGTSSRGQITIAPNLLDGVTLAVGNRILLKNQTVPAQNGIWVVTTLGTGANGVWDRATDFDTDIEVTAGSFTFISEGTQASSGWVLTTDNPIIVGGASGSSLIFAQFSGAGTYTAGNGLSLAAGVFSVTGTAARITVSGSGVDIASTYVGQNTITTVGTITTGIWNGTDIAVADGGTGGSTAAVAKTNLGFMTRFAVNIGDGANGGAAANGIVTSFTVTHAMNTLDVQVELQEIGTGTVIYANVTKATVNTLTVAFSVAPATSTTYRCIVLG